MDHHIFSEVANMLNGIQKERTEWKTFKKIDSPMMKEYTSFKEKKSDHILFFQIGDFYEIYGEDATLASDALNLKLTSREIKGIVIPMCGFPSSSGLHFANTLAKNGEKVCIISQRKDENEQVERYLDQIITPSAIHHDEFLSKDEHQYLMVGYEMKNEMGVVFFDHLSGSLNTRVINKYALFDAVEKFQPKEIKIYTTRDWETEFLQKVTNIPNIGVYKLPFFYDEMKEIIDGHKEAYFPNESIPYAVMAAHYFLIQLLEDAHPNHVTIRPLHHVEERDFLYLHKSAISGLELLANSSNKKKEKSLFDLLDQCCTAKGSRMLKNWIQEPLKDEKEIQKRYNLVEFFLNQKEFRNELREALSQMPDLERIMARVETQRFKDFELVTFIESLEKIVNFFSIIRDSSISKSFSETGSKYVAKINPIYENHAKKIKPVHIIAKGYDPSFDQIRETKETGLQTIESYFEQEKEKTGMKTLKLENNKTIGYHFEATKSLYDKIPDHFIVRRELSNKKQLVTDELKALEENYLDACEQYDVKYRLLIRQIALELQADSSVIRNVLEFVSILDVIMAFATVAETYHYKKPVLSENGELSLHRASHPLLQAFSYKKVVPNDCLMKEKDIHIITGPNVGGKTVYQKTISLCMIMAQIGSFVPADMTYTPVDRILLRMGANDSLHDHQSTFMVEMEELAYIIYHATKDSLIIVDELGRGTSTSDGISIAHSTIQYIHEHIQAKTLCSSHYHELTALENELSHVYNFHAEAKPSENELELTFKIKPGGSSKSFGLDVAKRVGLPTEIIENAQKLLENKYSHAS